MCPVLIGGKKSVRAKLKKGKYLGGNYEGRIYESKAVVSRNGRKRAINLAEKRFRHFDKLNYLHQEYPALRDPVAQFELVNELKKLNQSLGLGLHILPTVRLRRRPFRKPTLITTRYELFPVEKLPDARIVQLLGQMEKEQEILKSHGFIAPFESWKLIKDPFSGELTYYLADFGVVKKLSLPKK